MQATRAGTVAALSQAGPSGGSEPVHLWLIVEPTLAASFMSFPSVLASVTAPSAGRQFTLEARLPLERLSSHDAMALRLPRAYFSIAPPIALLQGERAAWADGEIRSEQPRASKVKRRDI